MKNNDMMTNQIQHSKTSRTSRLFALVLASLCSMLIAGCRADAPFGEEEKNTPTGCLKSQGRYYDPQLKECVKVTDQHQALVLNAYRYVNQLAEKDAGIVEFSIYPKTYLTIEEAEVLWADLRDKGAKMVVLSVQMPDNHVYDPDPGWETELRKPNPGSPKIWGGAGSAYHFNWNKQFNASADSIQDMVAEAFKTRETEKSLPELKKAIFEDDDLRVSGLDIKVDSKLMLGWWNSHLEEIEAVQPLVHFMDNRLPALGPMHKRTEGE